MNYDKVEDTFFEAFGGKYVRALITGPNESIVKRAAYDSTSTPFINARISVEYMLPIISPLAAKAIVVGIIIEKIKIKVSIFFIVSPPYFCPTIIAYFASK